MLNQINHMRDYHASSVIIFLMLKLNLKKTQEGFVISSNENGI